MIIMITIVIITIVLVMITDRLSYRLIYGWINNKGRYNDSELDWLSIPLEKSLSRADIYLILHIKLNGIGLEIKNSVPQIWVTFSSILVLVIENVMDNFIEFFLSEALVGRFTHFFIHFEDFNITILKALYYIALFALYL